ncbi:Hypothetical protein PACV_13 [Pacmanvirus A23]|uniref:Hypothetical protein n=1 Tax=Pacmanvirus A23 TaxID=1932881 RepID=UPI000A094ADA|nr:Hypothetical protein B9W72_gp013 [Pacmanvirus A23]SIP85730.1 Hypothetical protein PACV_13 [Pacmanvirus A23]
MAQVTNNTGAATTTLSLSINGSAGAGFLNLGPQTTPVPTSTAGMNIYSDGNNNLSWKNTTGNIYTIDTTTTTASRTWTMPNTSGVIALLSDVTGVETSVDVLTSLAKGEVIVGSDAGPVKLASTTNGDVLAVNTATASGFGFAPQSIPDLTNYYNYDTEIITSGAISTTIPVTIIGSGASGTFTLANPTQNGFIKSITLANTANTVTISTATDSYVLSSVFGYITLKYYNSVWYFISAKPAYGYPLAQTNKLVPSNTVGNAFIGSAVDMTSDGSTIVFSGYRDNGDTGAVWVYSRSGKILTQVQKIINPGSGNGFGTYGLAISKDGNYIAVGDITVSGGNGAVYIYFKSGATYTLQAGPLYPTGIIDDGVSNPSFGYNIDLSSNGTYLTAGAIGHNGSSGAVFVYLRTGTSWAQQAGPLTFSGATATGNYFGQTVRINDAGDTIAAAGPLTGVIAVFVRSGTSWSQQGGNLITMSGLGYSMSLSATGNNLYLGRVSGGQQVTLFSRSGTTWTQGVTILASAVGSSGESFGSSVLVNSTGDTMLVGAYQGNKYYILQLKNGSWTSAEVPSVTATSLIGNPNIGDTRSSSASADLSFAAYGGPRDNGDVSGSGGIWTFQ